MRFVRCECKDCHNEFMITFDNNIEDYKVSCPICKSENVKYTWINGDTD